MKTDLEKKARQLKVLELKISELQLQAEILKSEITEEMEAAGLDEMPAGPFILSWKRINSSRFDSNRFRAENEAIYAYYMIPTSYRRFSIMDRKKKAPERSRDIQPEMQTASRTVGSQT